MWVKQAGVTRPRTDLPRNIGAPRKYPEPKIGDRFGVDRVVRIIGRGHLGRSDLRVEVRCTCGARREIYEFNLRKLAHATACRHRRPR